MAANVKNFWGSYKSAVIASGVPEKNAEWFVRWAQKFSRSIKGKDKRSAKSDSKLQGSGRPKPPPPKVEVEEDDEDSD